MKRLILIDIGAHRGQKLELLTNHFFGSYLRCSIALVKKKIGVDRQFSIKSLREAVQRLNQARRRFRGATFAR